MTEGQRAELEPHVSEAALQCAAYLTPLLISAAAFETLNGEFIKHRQCQGSSENRPGHCDAKRCPKEKLCLNLR